MSRGVVLSLLLLAFMAAMLWFLTRSEGGIQELPRLIREALGVEAAPSPSPLPAKSPILDPRFSRGACQQNSDCKPGGCSGEVCSSDEDVVSTCEFSESFPNVRGLSCACLPAGRDGEGKCGWQ